jgi:hypothetical protein
MSWLKKLLGLHSCSPGVPHKRSDGKIVCTCYECGREHLWKLETEAA